MKSKKLKILYIGQSNINTTPGHRAIALKRLGHMVTIEDPNDYLNKKIFFRWMKRIHFKTGYYFLKLLLFSFKIIINSQ